MIEYNYSGLFNKKVTNDENEEEESEGLSSRWRWFSIVERLANGDITKFNEVYKVTYLTALNTLSYWKEKEDVKEMMRKRQELMNKHR